MTDKPKTGATIIHDPIPVESGGFGSGARFPIEQIRVMAEMGTLSEGAVIERVNGTRQVVRDGKLVRV